MSDPSTESTQPEAKMEVDSTGGEAAKSEEVKPDTASGEESKPDTASSEESKPAAKTEEAKGGETAAGGDAEAKAEMVKLRLNGAARKRFKWLLENGYEREEAGRLAKQPLTGELRDKYAADTKKVQEAEKETLSGAAKKRYAWLLKSGGYTKKEALILARKPMTAVAPKRNASDGGAGGPQSKFSKFTAGSPEGITMAVTCTDYPSTSLTNAQANQLKSAILKQVVQQKDAEVKPHFEYCTFAKGYLKVHCSDQKTREWLHRVVTKLELWEGASLKVVSEKKLFKSDIFTGHFNDSQEDSDAEILEFIQSQNDGLDTSKWKIISRKEIKPKKTTELMFTVDPASAKSILNLGYELNYKFNKVRLHKQEKPSTGPPPPMKRPAPIQRNPASFVPIWDSNFPRNRGGNYVQEPRNVFESPRNMNRSNVFDQNRYGGGNPKRYAGGNWNSGGGNPPFGNVNINAGGGPPFGNKRGSFNSGNPFNLVDSLLDQLKIIGGSNPAPSGGGGGNFGPNRGGGGGGGGGNFNFNQYGGGPGTGNSSRNSSFSGRSGGGGGGGYNPGNNRNFFTNSKSGFF